MSLQEILDMKVLIRKMNKFGILKFQMIIGAIVMLAAMIGLPVSIMSGDPSLILNPYVLGVVLIGMLMFGLFAYFLFMRPYFIYRKEPEVLTETDGEYLYIHGKKEAKIPLADLDGTSYFIHFPFLYSNELVATLVTHLLSEKYGDLDLDIPGYGSYKLRFVSDVYATANALMAFINQAINNN
jgi:hypothetical protein